MLDVYVYGSGECDQFGIEDVVESKVPKKVTISEEPSFKVYMVACGAMHTLVLTNLGQVFSFGCADDGVLGREGESLPRLVDGIAYPMTNVVAGDVHSIAYNTDLNLVYRWGLYRPELMESKHFERLNIKKIVCGANHTLALAGKSLFAWGNLESGQTGRNPNMVKKYMNEDGSYKTEESKEAWGKYKLKPVKMLTKNVVDVFTGQHHSFLYALSGKRRVLKGWGLNRHGQLGNGHKENVWVPQEITYFSTNKLEVKDVTGGDYHSLFLTTTNEIYSCGRNDEGQLGEDIPEKEEQIEELRDDVTKIGLADKTEDKQEQEDNDKDIALYPIKVKFFSQNTRPADMICSSMNFNYALDSSSNQLYSWGFGESYVLGNKDDSNETTPFTIPKTFYKNLNVQKVSLGSQFVTVTLYDPQSNLPLPSLEYDKEKYLEELRRKVEEKRTKTGKRKMIDMPEEEHSIETTEAVGPRRSTRSKSKSVQKEKTESKKEKSVKKSTKDTKGKPKKTDKKSKSESRAKK